MWRRPPVQLQISQSEIHVWRLDLIHLGDQIEKFRKLISGDEIERANRFLRENDYCRFIVCRGALRQVLSHYVARPPTQLRFRNSDFGKPILENAAESNNLCFSLSHSKGLALVAVAEKREVGIDVECVRRELDYSEIVEHFFSPSEKKALSNALANKKARSFYRLWVRKEALGKAIGAGLSAKYSDYEIFPNSERMVYQLERNSEDQKPVNYSLVDLYPDPSYEAALAGQGSYWRVSQWDFCVNW